MTRMTISRFKSTKALIAAAVIAAAAPLSAQDSAVVQQQPLQQSRVHIVSDGETLWTLAQLYLGDAFLWPEIYRLNTLVVEDPHWIFPGEELRLVPPDTVLVASTPLVEDPNQQLPVGDSVLIPVADSMDLRNVGDPELENQVTEALPPPPPPPPPSRGARTVFKQPGENVRLGLTVNRQPPPRPSGRLRFYSSGYLTEGEQFPWAEVLGAIDQPRLSALRATSSAMVFEQISVRAPGNATYHIGDSLMLSRFSRIVPGWGRLVVPTGIARVVAVDGRDVRAQIETQFDRVEDGQVALPLEPFRDRGGVDPVPIENGMRGSIITIRDQNPLAGYLNIVFIDRGRADGIVPGDEFEVIVEEEGSELPTTQIGILQVTHVRQRSAAAVITRLNGVGVRAGSVIRLIRKMP